MKKKPEHKHQPPQIDRPQYKEMSPQEEQAVQRARFLMTPFNIHEAQKHRSRIKFVFYLLIGISMVVTLIWALTR